MSRYRLVLLRIIIAAFLAWVVAGIPAEEAAAAYITVNSTADPGDGTCDSTECTLREAITTANASPGLDTIAFNIAPGGTKTIFPESPLPAITGPVTLDGATQPGFSGQPIVELAGTYTGGGSGLEVTAGGSTIRGLVINGFTGAGILLSSDGNTVAANYIGTDGNGPSSNADGVRVDGGDYNVIGGTTAVDRNVISGNTSNNILIAGGPETLDDCDDDADDDGDQSVNDGCPLAGVSAESGAACANATNDDPSDDSKVNDGCPTVQLAVGNMVFGNYIGTDATGAAKVTPPLTWTIVGVRINGGSLNMVGGTEPGSGNLISGHDIGVWVDMGTGNMIKGNLIGTNADGTAALGNHYDGVRIAGQNNVVGGNTPEARNVISGADWWGYGVSINGSVSTGNSVIGNFIGTDISGTLPLGNSVFGVELNGASANSVGGLSPGEGNVIAFNGYGSYFGGGVGASGTPTPGTPIRGNSIHSNTGKGISYYTSPAVPAVQAATITSASGTACPDCELDVFSDDADEGHTYHGSTVADAAGNWSFSGTITGPNVTATATNADGQTSEFSVPRALPDPAIDADGDGVLNAVDNCPNDANPGQENLDGDSMGDVCDPDDDNDGVSDGDDNCPVVANAQQQDGDGDGVGNACDNCPATANADQANLDGDSQGDACDTDDDGDGVEDIVDNCPTLANADQANADGDAMGDLCDPDADNDDLPNQLDPCPLSSDCDGDGVFDIGDNCPVDANSGQEDSDGDAVGDPCEPCAGAPASCVDSLSLDMEEDAEPANMATSIGTIEPCRRVNNNDILDADEDLVDSLVLDVVVGPSGVPAARPLIGFDIEIDYEAANLVIQALDVHQMIEANPGSDIYDLPSDDPPDVDGTLWVFAVDTGPGPGEAGPGVLARITVESVSQAPGFTTLTLTPNGIVDGLNDPVEVQSVFAAALALDTSCDVGDSDADGLPDPADNCPNVFNPDQVDNENDGLGNVCDPDDDNAGVYDRDEMSCGGAPFIAAIRPEWTNPPFAGTDDDGDTLIDEPLPMGAEKFDCDGDGWSGSRESGTPLCGNGVNDDGVVFGGSDDGVVDDGCPGGPAQVGAFSEASFNLGLTDQDPCGGDGWPAELVTTGSSANKVNLQDLASFVAPTRRLSTSPGQAGFSSRWDHVPGHPPLSSSWITLQDMATLVAGPTAAPPMLGGAKVFSGPPCPWAP